MASTVGSERPPFVVLALLGVAVVVVGLLLVQWFAGFVFAMIRLALILIGFVAVGWLALVLLRKGER